MADLWGALEEESNTEENRAPAVIEQTPDVIMIQDLINNDKIRSDTELLTRSLRCSAQIVVAAYKVADYVPNLTNDKHREFWQQKVIPTVVKSLDQDVKARSVVLKSFSTVRCMALTMKRGVELVKFSRGSPTAVCAAQRTITEAFKNLDEYIKIAESIDSSAINEFSGQTTELLQIMGPKAVNFAKERSDIEDDLRKAFEKQQKLYDEITLKKGELERYSHLMHVTQKNARGAEAALKETKDRTNEMLQLNQKVEQTIQNIPATILKTQTTTNVERSRWIPWWKTRTTTTESSMIENSNREVEKNYYESMVLSRMARIRENEEAEKAKEKVILDLERSFSKYKVKYETIVREIQDLENFLPQKIATIQKEIDELNQRLESINQKSIDAMNTYGHQGNTLVQCLAEIRTLAKAINNGATAYTPLVGVLKAVRASIDAQIELFKSEDQNDVFLAGNQLLRQVECLGNYETYASRCIEPPEDYKSISGKSDLKIVEVTEDSNQNI